jgi:hypothetical protein
MKNAADVFDDDRDVDPFDADYDPTEVKPAALDRDDISFRPGQPAVLPPPHPETRERCRQALAILAATQRRAAPPVGTARKPSSSWHAVPEAFRKLVARAAGLPAEVVGKLDRELTEQEKAKIRAAAHRLHDRAEELFAI